MPVGSEFVGDAEFGSGRQIWIVFVRVGGGVVMSEIVQMTAKVLIPALLLQLISKVNVNMQDTVKLTNYIIIRTHIHRHRLRLRNLARRDRDRQRS